MAVDQHNAGALVTALLDLVRDGEADLIDVETNELRDLVVALSEALACRNLPRVSRGILSEQAE